MPPATGLSASVKFTVTLVSTSTGVPLRRNGLYFLLDPVDGGRGEQRVSTDGLNLVNSSLLIAVYLQHNRPLNVLALGLGGILRIDLGDQHALHHA